MALSREPLLGFVVLTVRTGAMTAGVRHPVGVLTYPTAAVGRGARHTVDTVGDQRLVVVRIRSVRVAVAERVRLRGITGLTLEGQVQLGEVRVHGFVLRGCIGVVGTGEPLDRGVVRCCLAAATEDPRFESVSREELDDLTLEISVLSPLVPVSSPEEIAVGRDGLQIEKAGRRGLLLPQVPVEQLLSARL